MAYGDVEALVTRYIYPCATGSHQQNLSLSETRPRETLLWVQNAL